MNKLFISIGFAVMVLAQWFVPGKMILDQERVLAEGTSYKFRTRPIDPSDPLRGKYITLSYEMNKAKWIGEAPVNWKDNVYVYLKKDKNGFAQATQASNKPLKTDQEYVVAQGYGVYNDSINFQLSFTRFYMEESKAYPAELAVQQAASDSLLDNCYGLVFIKNGSAVLENVFVNDTPIKEYVEEGQQKNANL
ncbi:GDYXXLXY domain-containing protein [Marinirhabdus gelatinilytica]|uniref:Putative membrane-anchored protein n=1 Tax=Marinirhabdus gelatinilytica TaxID=1703343 RepID=A0A370Q7J4_9FLAO|nr:GDYXXLXY domain-containing protein [Marinirhabdus gelatinilytica]RDK84327.1 putative membrane-anchored protein [Marinirhabdus gelatinilytica]